MELIYCWHKTSNFSNLIGLNQNIDYQKFWENDILLYQEVKVEDKKKYDLLNPQHQFNRLFLEQINICKDTIMASVVDWAEDLNYQITEKGVLSWAAFNSVIFSLKFIWSSSP